MPVVHTAYLDVSLGSLVVNSYIANTVEYARLRHKIHATTSFSAKKKNF